LRLSLKKQSAACFFSRITDSHSVPAVSDCDYTLDWKRPAVEFQLHLFKCPAIISLIHTSAENVDIQPNITRIFF